MIHFSTNRTILPRLSGQGRKRSTLTVQLDPDVAAIFPDSGAINEGLRLLMRLIQQAPPPPGVESVTVSEEA